MVFQPGERRECGAQQDFLTGYLADFVRDTHDIASAMKQVDGRQYELLQLVERSDGIRRNQPALPADDLHRTTHTLLNDPFFVDFRFRLGAVPLNSPRREEFRQL